MDIFRWEDENQHQVGLFPRRLEHPGLVQPATGSRPCQRGYHEGKVICHLVFI